MPETRLTVVGLGPGPLEWVTAAARERLRTPGPPVFARTRLHPALDGLLEGVAWHSFDHLYEASASLDEVGSAMVEHLLAAGGDVTLAVPGDGMLGEALLARLRERGARVEIIPGVPLGLGALAAAEVDASDGAQT